MRASLIKAFPQIDVLRPTFTPRPNAPKAVEDQLVWESCAKSACEAHLPSSAQVVSIKIRCPSAS